MQLYEENNQEQTMNKIDLWDLAETMWKNFRRYWGRLLVLIAVITFLFTGYKIYSYHPVYESYVTFVVTKDNSNAADSVLSARIANTFPYVLKNGGLENQIRKEIGLVGEAKFPATLTASYMEDTNLLTITATSSNESQGQQIINAVIQYLPEYLTEVVGNTQMTVIDKTGLSDGTSNHLNILKTVFEGIAIGIVLTLGILFLLAYNDSTIRRYDDLKKYLNVTCLGSVPLTRFKKRKQKFDARILITNDKIPPDFAESISSLRARVEKEMRQKKKKTLLISSSVPGEGKTTVSLNLAIALSKRKKKVLLIDGDLRNPSLHTNLEIDAKDIKVGITDVLKGKAKPEEAIMSVKETGLDLILGRKATGNASGLLSSQKMQELLERVSKEYDYVIIDTPPAAMMADASVVAAYVDSVLYVIRQDYAKVKYVKEGMGLLGDSDVQVLGCVLNCAESGFGRYGYGKYSYGKYGYGYSKYSPEND